MTAQIIRLVPQSRGYVRDLRPNDSQKSLMDERKVRDQAWSKAEWTTRYFRQLLEFLDVTYLAAHTGIELEHMERAREFAPTEWAAHRARRDCVLDQLRSATEQQLLLPAAYEAQVMWKRVFARGAGFPAVLKLSVEDINRAIAADQAFLAACPRRRGGRTRSK